MKVHELVARCAKARETADPMKSMRALLDELTGDVAAIEAAVVSESRADGADAAPAPSSSERDLAFQAFASRTRSESFVPPGQSEPSPACGGRMVSCMA